MKTVVTGGAGFIGSHVVERLTGNGYETLVIDNLVAGAHRASLVEGFGARLEKVDIRDPAAGEAISSFQPDVVIHLAAQLDVRKSVEDPLYDADVNIVGTLRMLEASSQVGARFVFSSSGGCIYGEPGPELLPISEDVIGRPTSPYGIGKKVAEDYLRFYQDAKGLAFVSLAFANVYGPRQDPHGEAGVVAIFGSRLLRGETCVIFGDGSQTRDFVFVGDVADVVMAAIAKGDGHTFNIGTGKETSVNELYEIMAPLCGTDARPKHEPARIGELERSSLDNSLARRILDWEPKVSLEEGLAATVSYLRAEVERD